MFKLPTVCLRSFCKGLVRRGYATDTENAMKLTFAAANKVFYDEASVKQVDVPSFSGSFGILAHHVPSLAVLKPGVVTVFENSGTSKQFFVSSGTVTINEDSSVQVLAEEACEVDQLDSSAIREILSKAQSEYASATNEEAKEEAAVVVEVAEALSKAVS
uniref:F-ATPase delta subunit n=1 Tax=Cuerna arida TaxID=1464854 RepID=A0A1B6EML8_9HEMI